MTDDEAKATFRANLTAKVGQTWDTTELQQDYDVTGFCAPFVVVTRKSDNVRGSLEFTHHPRFYFSFTAG